MNTINFQNSGCQSECQSEVDTCYTCCRLLPKKKAYRNGRDTDTTGPPSYVLVTICQEHKLRSAYFLQLVWGTQRVFSSHVSILARENCFSVYFELK